MTCFLSVKHGEQLAQDQQQKLGTNVGTSIELRTVMYEDSSDSLVRSWGAPD